MTTASEVTPVRVRFLQRDRAGNLLFGEEIDLDVKRVPRLRESALVNGPDRTYAGRVSSVTNFYGYNSNIDVEVVLDAS